MRRSSHGAGLMLSNLAKVKFGAQVIELDQGEVAAAQESGLSPSPSPTPGMDKGAAISVQMASIALTGASLIFSLLLPLLNH
nr:hypothetical protein Iba_chr04eCG12540 [Ipomoea batatas]